MGDQLSCKVYDQAHLVDSLALVASGKRRDASRERENAGGERKRKRKPIGPSGFERPRRRQSSSAREDRRTPHTPMAETHSTEAVRTLVMNDELPTQYGKPSSLPLSMTGMERERERGKHGWTDLLPCVWRVSVCVERDDRGVLMLSVSVCAGVPRYKGDGLAPPSLWWWQRGLCCCASVRAARAASSAGVLRKYEDLDMRRRSTTLRLDPPSAYSHP